MRREREGGEAVNKGKVKWLVSLQITLLPVFLTSFLPEAYTMEKQRPPQMSACAVHFLHSTKCMCEGRLSGQAGRQAGMKLPFQGAALLERVLGHKLRN